jgi:hypothetical protein
MMRSADRALILTCRQPVMGYPLTACLEAELAPPVGIGPVSACSIYGRPCYAFDVVHADGRTLRRAWFKTRDGEDRRVKLCAIYARQVMVAELRDAGPLVITHDEASTLGLQALVSGGRQVDQGAIHITHASA